MGIYGKVHISRHRIAFLKETKSLYLFFLANRNKALRLLCLNLLALRKTIERNTEKQTALRTNNEQFLPPPCLTCCPLAGGTGPLKPGQKDSGTASSHTQSPY